MDNDSHGHKGLKTPQYVEPLQELGICKLRADSEAMLAELYMFTWSGPRDETGFYEAPEDIDLEQLVTVSGSVGEITF